MRLVRLQPAVNPAWRARHRRCSLIFRDSCDVCETLTNGPSRVPPHPKSAHRRRNPSQCLPVEQQREETCHICCNGTQRRIAPNGSVKKKKIELRSRETAKCLIFFRQPRSCGSNFVRYCLKGRQGNWSERWWNLVETLFSGWHRNANSVTSRLSIASWPLLGKWLVQKRQINEIMAEIIQINIGLSWIKLLD